MTDQGASELPAASVLSDVERRAITGFADIRRDGQLLVSDLAKVSQDPVYTEAAEPVRDAWRRQSELVSHIIHEDVPAQDSGASPIEAHIQSADQNRDIAPNLAALHFAKAALLQQAAGLDYEETLRKAKYYRNLAEEEGIGTLTPGDLLPDALILRIAKNATRDVEMPDVERVARASQTDRSLISDYALVLPEERRPEYVGAFPEGEQGIVSLEMDAALSEVLNSDLINTVEDQAQRQQVIGRVMQAFAQSLGTLGRPDAFPQGREPGSRWTGKQIMETLLNVGGEDSIRILKDISEHTTSQLKALNKQLKKKPAAERAALMRPFMSFTARVLDTLVEVDTRRGGVLAMRYLEMTALPNRLFTHFSRKLVVQSYFSASLTPFLENPANIPVIKKIMSRHGSQLNTIVDTLVQIPDYVADHDLVTREAELLEALDDLGTLTPRIFERYRAKTPEERKAFAAKIRELKPQFFRNTPIKGILRGEDRDILTEMVYVAYKPMGMSFEKVSELIGKVDDRTEDVARYTFPENGYPVMLERRGRYTVREKQQVDISALRRFRDVLRGKPEDPAGEEQAPDTEPSFQKAIRALISSEPAAEDMPDEARQQSADTALLRQLLAPFSQEPRVQEFLQRSQDIGLDNAHETASELAEIMGVYFHDNYERILADYFTGHEDVFAHVAGLLSSDEVRGAMDTQFAQFGATVNWGDVERALHPPVQDRLKQLIATGTSQKGEAYVASLITRLIEGRYIGLIQKGVKGELAKFVAASGDGGYASKGTLQAYISKNVGSFFAKASAGLCTAEDIPLFNRGDHFHINVVEGDEAVRANIMAYVVPVNGRPSLVLRGFNPTADWVSKIDVESFCEQIIAIGKDFQQSNGLAGVYITTQGSWHALSNRDQVARYLVGRYHGQKGIDVNLPVGRSHGGDEHVVKAVYPV